MSTIIHKTAALKVAAIDPQGQAGRFSGIAVLYGERDAYGDTIRQGAFSKSISDAGGKFPLLWVHRHDEPLGSIRVEQDERALSVSGMLLVDEIPRAKQVHALLRERCIRGLSVGFLPVRAAPLEGGATEYLECKLLEVSVCCSPAFPSAEVQQIRALSDLAQRLNPTHDRAALLALRASIDAMLEPDTHDVGEELARALASCPQWRR